MTDELLKLPRELAKAVRSAMVANGLKNNEINPTN